MSTRLARPTTLPEELESPRAKLVYLFLATNGGASLTDLQDCLGLKQLTLYSILDTLDDRGLVVRTDSGYRCSD